MNFDFWQELTNAFSQPGVPELSLEPARRQRQDELMKKMTDVVHAYPLQEPLCQLKTKTEIHYYHSLRVGLMIYELTSQEETLLRVIPHQSILAAGLLHDYGKTLIPDEILKKSGEHNSRERQIMRSHNRLSFASPQLQVLEENYFPYLRKIAIRHHPYPRQKNDRRATQRRQLELLATSGLREGNERRRIEQRITNLALDRAGVLLALCDQYDAWNSRREYKEPDTLEKVREKFYQNFPAEEISLLDYLILGYPNPLEK